jgi:hypothetical protein
MIGRKCFEVTHRRLAPCDGPHITCSNTLIFERGEKVAKVLHSHYNIQGDEKQIEITASPVRNDYRQIIAMVETHRDIMEKKTDVRADERGPQEA